MKFCRNNGAFKKSINNLAVQVTLDRWAWTVTFIITTGLHDILVHTS